MTAELHHHLMTKPAATRAAGYLLVALIGIGLGAAFVTDGFKAAPAWWSIWTVQPDTLAHAAGRSD